MKPVLLIYPPFEGKTLLKSRIPFPIGPLYIAAYLESKGMAARVIDFCYPHKRTKIPRPSSMKTKQTQWWRFGWTDDEIRAWLKKNLKRHHHVVGVSSLMSSTYNGGYRVIKLIKEIAPETTVVIGGPHATAFPYHVEEHSEADYVCIGEGEYSLYSFLKGKKHEGIQKPGKAESKRTQFIEEMDELPFPRRSLLMDDRKIDSLCVTFSRGCPHKCSFCGSFLIQGRKWRYKSVPQVIAEIQFYQEEWGVKHFEIEDDNICPGKVGINWLKRVCQEVIAEGIKARFHIPHGIPVYATADKELCGLLWKAGFRNMVFPLESTNPETLRDMKKEFTPSNWRKAVTNWTYEKNHPAEIIIGYPFVDTVSSMLQTMVDIAEMKGRVWASHFRLNKGTPLFERCLEAGYIDETYDPINTNAFFIETERFNLNDLSELMQISRGINFGTERGYDVFKDDLGEVDFRDFQFIEKDQYKPGDLVATGKFAFKRAQNIFASLLLLRCKGPKKGRPYLVFGEDKETIYYKENKPSRVYDELRTLITGKKNISIKDFMDGQNKKSRGPLRRRRKRS